MGRSRRRDSYKPAKPTAAAPTAGRFADQLLTCEQCGRQFVFTVEQQRRRADLGLPSEAPSLCPICAPADYAAPVETPPRQEHREERSPARVAPAAAAPSRPKTEREPVRDASGKRERQESGAGFTVRSLGHVKWYDDERGYGFIVDEETGEEYFVHQSALESGMTTLLEGQLVEFEVVHRQKGPEAVYILTL